jgi:hypothetical protein
MSRRSFFVTTGVVILLLGASATALAVLIRYEYAWYNQAALPPGELRARRSEEFLRAFSEMHNVVMGDSEDEWEAKFTDEQINSYFDEGFVQSGLDIRMLPDGVHHPRIIFDNERIHLAFRYGRGMWSTIISIDFRVWLPKREQNVVSLELEGFHAGALPISAQSLLEKVSEVGRLNGIGVEWYRNPETGHPVAVLKFQADQPRSTMRLQAVQVDNGTITIRGRSTDAILPRAFLSVPGMSLKLNGN